jgi:hypothetical protein
VLILLAIDTRDEHHLSGYAKPSVYPFRFLTSPNARYIIAQWLPDVPSWAAALSRRRGSWDAKALPGDVRLTGVPLTRAHRLGRNLIKLLKR